MLIINIKELVGIVEDGSLMKAGAAMSEVNRIENAFLYIKGKKIADYGKMDSPEYQQYLQKERKVVDAKGGIVMPTFCDSHTHIVYANSREMEFVDKIKGLSYEEIAKLLDMQPPAVRMQLSRARKTIRECYKQLQHE